MVDLSGKKILVTGASGGIGQSLCQTFADQGAVVIASGTRKEALEAVVAGLPGGTHHALAANLGEDGAAAQLVADALAVADGLDGVVNNAGITRDGLLMRMPDADWHDVLQLNLTRVMEVCRAAIRPMMKARAGRIINITSIVGHMGNAGQTNYVAAKAGLTGFSKALALEVASRGITVNCIAPGFIETPMTEKLSQAQRQAMLERIPLAAFGQPEDVAAAALYLAGRSGRYVTGQTLHVNGGMWLA